MRKRMEFRRLRFMGTGFKAEIVVVYTPEFW